MTTQAKLMGSGIASAAALQITSGDLTNSITAAGTTQATAQAVYAEVNLVTAVAVGAGVLLPSNRNVGDLLEVVNLGANALAVYPPLSSAIGTGATNAAFSVPVSKVCTFRMVTSTLWVQNLSA